MKNYYVIASNYMDEETIIHGVFETKTEAKEAAKDMMSKWGPECPPLTIVTAKNECNTFDCGTEKVSRPRSFSRYEEMDDFD